MIQISYYIHFILNNFDLLYSFISVLLTYWLKLGLLVPFILSGAAEVNYSIL